MYKFNKLEDELLKNKGEEVVEESKVNSRKDWDYDHYHSKGYGLSLSRPLHILELSSGFFEVIY